MARAIVLTCANGHTQRITFEPPKDDNEAHDLGVLLAGGTLRSIGRGCRMPGYPCQRLELVGVQAARGDDGTALECDVEVAPCGARVTFTVEP